MLRSPRTSNSKSAGRLVLAVIGISIPIWSLASAQNFATRVAGADSLGLSDILPTKPALGLALGEELKGGFTYGLEMDSVYNSNFSLTDSDPASELSLILSPWIRYGTDPEGGAKISFTANYYPVIQTYLENSDLNGIDQSGNFTMSINGSKTMISAYASYRQSSGTDPIIGEFVNETLFSSGIQASYQIASRTTLSARFSTAISDYSSNSVVGSSIYTTYIGGYWSATERLSFGPAINYVVAKSDNTGTRDAWDISMQAHYKVGELIQVAGSLGVQYAKNSRDAGSSTIGLTGRLGVNYAINEKLTWVSSVRYVTVPSPTELDYVINNLMVTTALNRELLRAQVGLGIDLNIASYQGVGAVTAELGNKNIAGGFLSYSRKFFLERLNFDSKVRYSVSNGQTNWSQFVVSVGLRVQF